MTSPNTALKSVFYTALAVSFVVTPNLVHAGSRHKGLLEALPSPGSDKPVKKPVPPPGSRIPPAGKSTAGPELATPVAPDALYTAPTATQCNFSSETGFGTWTILQALPGKMGTVFLVAASQASNAQPLLISLDVARGAVSFPLGREKTILRLYANSKSGDLVATTPQDGIYVYQSAKNTWTPMYSGQRFHGFAWRGDTVGYTLVDINGVRTLTKLELFYTHTYPHAYHTHEDVRVTDANGDWILMIRRPSPGRAPGEILRVHERRQSETVSVSENTRALEALFTAGNAHVLSLEDIEGKGASVWVTAHKGGKRRPFAAETSPVREIFLSPDRLTIGITTDDWGIRSSRLVHIDHAASAAAQWPIDRKRFETLRVFPLNGDPKRPLAFAVRSSPEQADALIGVEGTGTRVVWAQKLYSCLLKWRRTVLKRTDGSDLIVDIYEPKTPADAPKRSLVHIARHESPHAPEFRALRTYWIQNGWTILEPHIRGSNERGTDFILAGSPPAPWQDVQQALKFEADNLGSKTRTLKIVSDLPSDKLGGTGDVAYSCLAVTPDGNCATRDTARSVLK